VVLIGEEELAKGTVTVRDLEQGSQESLPRGEAATYLRRSR
jgi:histidyl-tRNA synthetase